jgi:transcriptional/translational regulatory protein YebC/TACO1
MFHRKARFVIEGEKADEETLMELCFGAEVEVEEITADEDIAEILAPPESFNALAMALEADGIVPAESGVVRIPENQVQINDTSVAKQVVRLLDNLEDCDDVQGVVSNADFDDAVLEELAADE